MICVYLWVIAQIVLESFPVSSSGHVQLLAQICPVLPALPQQVLSAFDYALHLPTVCVVALFFRRAWSFPFIHLRRCRRLVFKISAYTASATIVTLAGYGLRSLVPFQIVPLPLGFFITMCSLLSLRRCPEKPYAKLDFKKVLVLGLLQACALSPGISRFAITFVGARRLGIPARRAFEISFLIQWPLIVCASLYGIYVLHADSLELLNPALMCVMLCSSGVAYAGLYMQTYMIQKKIMWRWGIYMCVPLAVIVILGVVNA